MNRLVLIGNGFDLACGLRTSYYDFIDWYLNEVFRSFREQFEFEDTLMKIERISNRFVEFPEDKIGLSEFIRFFNASKDFNLQYQSHFFQKLMAELNNQRWVDIERFYFLELKREITNIQPNNKGKNFQVRKLNNEFKFIANKLKEYIQIVNKNIPLQELQKRTSSSPLHYKLFIQNKRTTTRYVNFNYTDTLLGWQVSEVYVNHIHGKISNLEKFPLVFGYGDESDPFYSEIENSGENIYLENIKSFNYFKNDSLHSLLDYIGSDLYEISIVGLSCGLSDRVLLNELFEHQNCQSIEIYYHQKENGENNYTEITNEISRHFKNKNKMRRLIQPLKPENIIPQIKI